MGSTLSISQEVAVKLITNSIVSQGVTGVGRSTSKLTLVGVGMSFSSLCGIMPSTRASDPSERRKVILCYLLCSVHILSVTSTLFYWLEVESLVFFKEPAFGFVHFFFLFWFIFHYVLPLLFFFFYIFWLDWYWKKFLTRYLLICSFSFSLWISCQHDINSPSKVWCLLSCSLECFRNVLWSFL